jgi:hypothetical protein
LSQRRRIGGFDAPSGAAGWAQAVASSTLCRAVPMDIFWRLTLLTFCPTLQCSQRKRARNMARRKGSKRGVWVAGVEILLEKRTPAAPYERSRCIDATLGALGPKDGSGWVERGRTSRRPAPTPEQGGLQRPRGAKRPPTHVPLACSQFRERAFFFAIVRADCTPEAGGP